MILTEERLQDLLDKSLAELPPDTEWAVTLEGSIAEGFGNPSSDIDFLLVSRRADDLPTMPSLLFVDGRRVEIRTRSVRQLAEQFREVERSAGRPAGISEDLLNRCQRVLHSHPLRGHALVEEVKALLPGERFRRITAHWWAHRARQSLRHALALQCLGESDEAVDWTRAALVQSVKSWAADLGETYLEPKWLSMQLDRAGRTDVRDRYWELESAAVPPGDAGAAHFHLTACLDFAEDLGLTDLPRRPERLTVARVAGVTTWQTGERVHVVRGRRDVFALGADAGGVWRSLVLGRPLPRVLADSAVTGVTDPGRIVAAFLRHGLVRLAWKGGGTVTPALPLAAPPGHVTPPPSTLQPLLSVGGAAVTGSRAVDLMPLPADRFAAAAMALVWSNVVVENAVEDLTGALRRGQHRVAELTARRAVHAALRGLFSAHGVNPLPADTDLVRRMELLPEGTVPIGVRARELLARGVRSAEDGDALRAELRRFIALVRGAVGADSFPLSFDSAYTWRATLQLGHDWLRMGAHLGAELPIEEARDLLAGNGAQPHPAR
ncbi:nucleotidyltransferase domain-containing protein [Streptomyces aureus]|uniref:nucleotidyltransferase domain-containing protein n=1 Tax=Streptomyces aureus TaxID=193461 RepID=UPI000560F4ED|nr:nucleotidyltransferase domain-containing protein [Streptomyces aureus]